MARRRAFEEEEVIERAMQLFWERGYRSTSPQNLVDATGLSKSSLYGTFDSKQGIFLAALARYIDEQVEQMRSVIAGGTLHDGLSRMFDTLIEMTSSGRTCLLCSSTLEAPLDDPDVAALLAEGSQRIETVFHERLVQAQQAGELAADRDARVLARFVLNNNTGLMVLARTHASSAQLRSIADEVLRALA